MLGAPYAVYSLGSRSIAGEGGSPRREVPAGREWELIFIDGLSTKNSADEFAGRGVGLSAAREELGQVGYLIHVDSST